MLKVELKTLIFSQLKEIFVPRGYKAITGRNFLVRKTPTGFHQYFFEIKGGYYTHTIVDGFGLRIDAIENIIKAGVLPVLPDWDKVNNDTTVRLDYGLLKFAKIYFEYPEIGKLEEAMAVLGMIKTFMLEEGFALLDEILYPQ